jgi:hypothetical protein
MKTKMLLFMKYRFILFTILISSIAVVDLFTYGLPPTHDGEYHVMRFQQFHKALSEGNLYPRWAGDFNNGYGIPLFNYVYPLPNYFASFLHFLGISFIGAFKLNMVVASMLGAVFFYLWTRRFWGDIGAMVSSVVYTFAPYHLLDIYVRGSVGEVWSLAIIPGLLWAYSEHLNTKKIQYFCLSVLFLALLVFAHNILAVVFTGFFILYSLFLIYLSKKKELLRDFISLFLILVLGIGTSSIFWLPAILETKYVTGLQLFDPTIHFPEIHKLIYSSWGYGFSGEGVPDQMSFQIGIPNLLIVGFAVILTFIRRNKLAVFFLALFALTTFLVTPLSRFFWDNVPGVSYIQFPWRLLSLIILLSSFLAGFLVKDISKSSKKSVLLGSAILILSIGYSLGYAKAPFYHPRNDSYYLARPNFTQGTNSPGDEFNVKGFDASLSKASSRFESDASIDTIESESSKEVAIIQSKNNTKLTSNIAYFPGWTAYINSSPVGFSVTDRGLIELEVPKGRSEVKLELRNTKIRTLSLVLTILSLGVLFGLFVRDKYIKIR